MSVTPAIDQVVRTEDAGRTVHRDSAVRPCQALGHAVTPAPFLTSALMVPVALGELASSDKRADADTTTGTGLVGTITLADAFIDVLRARTQVVPIASLR